MKKTALKRCRETIKDTFLPGDNLHIVVGTPELAISKLADELDSRMIVLGTVSRTGLKGYIMGNTAEQILYHMNCDVLAVKPDNFSVNK